MKISRRNAITGSNPYFWTLTDPRGGIILNKYYNTEFTEFTEGHQYWRTDGLGGTGLMPYKAHSLKYRHFMLFPVPVYSKYEI